MLPLKVPFLCLLGIHRWKVLERKNISLFEIVPSWKVCVRCCKWHDTREGAT